MNVLNVNELEAVDNFHELYSEQRGSLLENTYGYQRE